MLCKKKGIDLLKVMKCFNTENRGGLHEETSKNVEQGKYSIISIELGVPPSLQRIFF